MGQAAALPLAVLDQLKRETPLEDLSRPVLAMLPAKWTQDCEGIVRDKVDACCDLAVGVNPTLPLVAKSSARMAKAGMQKDSTTQSRLVRALCIHVAQTRALCRWIDKAAERRNSLLAPCSPSIRFKVISPPVSTLLSPRAI